MAVVVVVTSARLDVAGGSTISTTTVPVPVRSGGTVEVCVMVSVWPLVPVAVVVVVVYIGGTDVT